ncbi:MAG TPA: flagellar protein [Ruminococcaceae bacterium]|jgi:flagellar operon protein|nr:flagellar protein [Oscillospiraceae bacterium]
MDHLLAQQRARILTDQLTDKPVSINKGQTYSGDPFDKILQKQLENSEKLSFTKHAQLRMSERNIHLTEDHLERLDEAVKKADQKGVKDTLVFMDQMAFIVSVINKTVVTAISGDDVQGNVFTHIDGAVIV